MGDVKFHDVETIIFALTDDTDIVNHYFICPSDWIYSFVIRVSDGLAPETLVI